MFNFSFFIFILFFEIKVNNTYRSYCDGIAREKKREEEEAHSHHRDTHLYPDTREKERGEKREDKKCKEKVVARATNLL